jgi:hypothetical protein
VDSIGQALNVSGGDHVSVFGFDGEFEVVSIRPERVAVIRNCAPGYAYTSSVPLTQLTRLSRTGQNGEDA